MCTSKEECAGNMGLVQLRSRFLCFDIFRIYLFICNSKDTNMRNKKLKQTTLSLLKTTTSGKDNNPDIDTMNKGERFCESITHCVKNITLSRGQQQQQQHDCVTSDVTTMEKVGDEMQNSCQ